MRKSAPKPSQPKPQTYFTGTREESRARLPQECVDMAVKALGIDPDLPAINNDKLCPRTQKEELWDDLIFVIWRFGKPTPTQLGTTPAELKKHAKFLNDELQSFLSLLNSLQYGPLFDLGTMTKEFVIADRLRSKSEIMRSNASKTPGNFVAAGYIMQDYESNKAWGLHYPFDKELSAAISALEKLRPYFDEVLKDSVNAVPSKGKLKKAKSDHDNLIYSLCIIFKKFTGVIPRSSPRDDGTATGKIIPFLQAVLPHTSYGRELTAWGLQKKLERLSKMKNYKSLWQDTKD